MPKLSAAWVIFFILIIAIFLRFNQLSSLPPGLYPDEAMNGNNASEAITTGEYKVFYPENNGREGLFINFQALLLKLIGKNEPWVLRLASAIVGTLTVLGVFLLTKELFTVRAGLLAAFFMATSFWHLLFSRIGFRAIAAPFFLAFALYFLLLALRRAREDKDFVWASLLGGIFFGLGFHTYIAYRIMPLLLLPFLFLRRSKRFYASLALFLIAAFIAGLPLGIYYLKHPADFMGRTTQVSVFSSSSAALDLGRNIAKTVGMFFVSGDYNPRHNLAGQPALFWPVALFFLTGIIIAVKKIFRRKQTPGDRNESFPYLLISAWLVLAVLPVVISNEGIPHALRSILMLPPAIILAAVGGLKLHDLIAKFLSSHWLSAIRVVFIVLFIFEAWSAYFILWANNPDTSGAFAANYVELGRTLNNIPATVPKYVIVEAGGVDVRGMPMPTQTTMFITDTFRPEKQKEKNIYYVLSKDENSIPNGALRFHLK